MSNTLAQANDALQPLDRRVHSRQPIRSLAYVELDEGNGGIVLNLSEGGFSVQAVTSLMDDLLPGVRFQLSESEGWVEANARITWTGQSRKVAGLEFVNLPEDARSRIRQWLDRETQPAEAPRETTAPLEEKTEAAGESVSLEATIPASQAAETEPITEALAEKLLQVGAYPVEDTAATPVAPVSIAVSSAPGKLFAPAVDANHELRSLPNIQSSDPAPNVAARLFRSNWALVALVALLAIGSLAAGWAAGEGDFGKFLKRAEKLAPQDSHGTTDAVTTSAIPAPRVSEIEIVNASNQRWTIPFNGSLSVSGEGIRREVTAKGAPPAHKAQTGFRTWILTPPLPSRTAANSSEPLKENPPAVSNAVGAAENFLSSSGSLISQALAGSPTLRVPAPAATGIVKQGHLIRRVDPTYPVLARNLLVEGTVRLNVTIGQDGAVRGVALLGGPRLLVDAAEAAVRQWRYSPSTLDGKPIEFQQEVDLRFHLSNAAR